MKRLILLAILMTPLAFLALPSSAQELGSSVLLAKKKSKKKPTKKKAAKKKSSKKSKKQAKRPLQKNKRKKSRGLAFGLSGGGAYETLTVKNADADDQNYTGFAFGGMLLVDYPLLGCCSLWGGGGLHIVNFSGSDDVSTFKISTTSILINSGINYNLSRSFSIGGVFEFLTLMSGSYSFEVSSELVEASTELKLESGSRIGFGGDMTYRMSPSLFLSGTFMIANGSVVAEAQEGVDTEPQSVATNGFVIRGLIGYLF